MKDILQQALSQYFGALNEVQRRAVFTVKGPLLILAGAGSGKTTVLVRRIENLILFGDAYSSAPKSVPPQTGELLKRYLSGESVEPHELSQAIGKDRVRP